MSISICLVRHVEICHVRWRRCPCATRCSACSPCNPARATSSRSGSTSSMSNAWHASHWQIYPELARLQEAGHGRGRRRGRAPQPHLRGHRRRPRGDLRDWLLETEPNRAQRNETTVRWFLLQLLEPEDRRAALERELRDAPSTTPGWSRPPRKTSTRWTAAPVPPDGRPRRAHTSVMVDWLTEQLEAIARRLRRGALRGHRAAEARVLLPLQICQRARAPRVRLRSRAASGSPARTG